MNLERFRKCFIRFPLCLLRWPRSDRTGGWSTCQPALRAARSRARNSVSGFVSPSRSVRSGQRSVVISFSLQSCLLRQRPVSKCQPLPNCRRGGSPTRLSTIVWWPWRLSCCALRPRTIAERASNSRSLTVRLEIHDALASRPVRSPRNHLRARHETSPERGVVSRVIRVEYRT